MVGGSAGRTGRRPPTAASEPTADAAAALFDLLAELAVLPRLGEARQYLVRNLAERFDLDHAALYHGPPDSAHLVSAMGAPLPGRPSVEIDLETSPSSWLVLERGAGFPPALLARLQQAGPALGAALSGLQRWQQVTAAEEIFRSLFEALPVPAMLVKDGAIMAANLAMARLTRYDEATLRQLGVSALLTSDERPNAETGGLVAVWPNDGEAPLRVRAAVGPYPQIPGAQVMVLLTDAEPRFGMDGLTAGLASGVAHSFNNLLQAVVGYASLTANRGDLAPEVRDNLTCIEAAGRDMARMTADLVAYARVGLVHPEELPFEETVARAARSDSAWSPLKLQLQAGDAAIRGDRQLVELVVRNLLLNAREAAGKAPVMLSTRVVTVTGAESGVGIRPRPGCYGRLRVVDPGHGVPPELLPHIFRPFVSSRGLGRGMGLAAVEGVCVQHGGGVLLQSQPGETRIEAFFPILES